MNTKYHVLGIMSGTSLDGIDLAECFFEVKANKIWTFKIGVAKTIPYPSEWRLRLQEAIHFSSGRLTTLNSEYTEYLSGIISSFITQHQLIHLDAVCSHGHTILHQPWKGITLQIGNLPQLAVRIQQKVICDFRTQDVALGGQGAPLVPIGDRLLFSEFDFCLNLGGFANVSSERDTSRIAYDICPVNIVLNKLAAERALAYDEDGKLARSGTVDQELLKRLNSLPFYSKKAPKSLGLEWVKQHVDPILDSASIAVEDKLATFTEHAALQIAMQFNEHARVLVTGGGAYNSFLLERMKVHKNIKLVLPEKKIIDYKEALIFGLLGVLRLRGENNCLASVTGARKDHSSGEIYLFNPI